VSLIVIATFAVTALLLLNQKLLNAIVLVPEIFVVPLPPNITVAVPALKAVALLLLVKSPSTSISFWPALRVPDVNKRFPLMVISFTNFKVCPELVSVTLLKVFAPTV